MHHKEWGEGLLEKRPRQAPGDRTRSMGMGAPLSLGHGEIHQRKKKRRLHAERCSWISGQGVGKGWKISSGGFYPCEKGGKPSAEGGVGKSCGKTRIGGMVILGGRPEWPTRAMDAGGSMVLAGSKTRKDDLRQGNGVARVTRRLVVSSAEKGT